MKNWSRIAVTSAIAIALATPAMAQSGSTEPTNSPAPAESTMPAEPDSARSSPSPAVGGDVLVEQSAGQALSSELVGIKVVGPDGKSIGEVSELIVEDAELTGAVLEVGGFLGLGAKRIGVPWDALEVSELEGSTVAMVALTKEQLASMPEFRTLAEVKAEQSRASGIGTTGGVGTGGSTGTAPTR